MEQYISKDALVAEIENLLDKGRYHEDYDCAYRDGNNGALYALKGKLNTLEVKEVDLETQIEDYINSRFTEGCDGGMISDWYKVLGGVYYKDLVEIAKHFFELGLRSTITEEDCKLIWNIGDEIPQSMSEEEFFKELLKRYKAQKGEEYEPVSFSCLR